MNFSSLLLRQQPLLLHKLSYGLLHNLGPLEMSRQTTYHILSMRSTPFPPLDKFTDNALFRVDNIHVDMLLSMILKLTCEFPESDTLLYHNRQIYILRRYTSFMSVLIDFLGDSPMIKVLDYLLTERELDFSITDMADNAGVGRSTLYRLWDLLIKNDIIVPTRIIGKAKLFKLNTTHPGIRKLIDVEDALVQHELRRRKIAVRN